MIEDNKIKIPWYRRNVPYNSGEDSYSGSGNIDIPDIPRPRPQPRPRPKPVPEPVPVKVRVPVVVPKPVNVREPVTVPSPSPSPVPSPVPSPAPDIGTNPYQEPRISPGVPNPYPSPNPLPPFVPPPARDNGGKQPAPQPTPLPAFMDWDKAKQNVLDQAKQVKPAKPSPARQTFDNAINPLIHFILAKHVADEYIRVKVKDPIYKRMLKDPVLGAALREADKANMDMEIVATYFANYDYENIDVEEMTADLTKLVGAAGAARLLIYFVGKKVLFKR